MSPLEVYRREEGKKGGRDEGMKGERERHCEEENLLVALNFGSLIPRFSPHANENPTTSNEMLGGAWE